MCVLWSKQKIYLTFNAFIFDVFIAFVLQIGFFKKGIELVSKKMDSFLNSVSNMTQK